MTKAALIVPSEIWWPLSVGLEHTGGKHIVPFHMWLVWHHQFMLSPQVVT